MYVVKGRMKLKNCFFFCKFIGIFLFFFLIFIVARVYRMQQLTNSNILLNIHSYILVDCSYIYFISKYKVAHCDK